MNINDVNLKAKASRKRRRVGRGIGSGRGKTSQRGHKGQGSRSGSSMNPVFEGGQMPLVRRIPKRGFNNKGFADIVIGVNVDDLEIFFDKGETVTPQSLKEKGVVKKVFDRIKILGNGELTKPLDVSAHSFSATAQKKIEAVGGKVVVLPEKKPVVKNKMGSRKKALLSKS
ncbi:MAG: 50S ribosomal protein L15 [Planctomycetaceae bacterium]|jgi:large subunit ribosomal protein L15|nr:50S ribosomal protein L15 [Planctomycetaceae bacterium]